MIIKTVILIAFGSFVITKFLNSQKKIKAKFLMNSTFLATLVLIYWIISGTPFFIINIKWLSMGLKKFSMSVVIDFPFIMFSMVALYVTWSIIEFSKYYMEKDPKKKLFMKTLILFLLFMMVLVSSKKLFVLFIGWEGVGIMSFVLIGWWFTRSDAKRSALQAIIYKRIGDRGIILLMARMIISSKSWKLNYLTKRANDYLLTLAIVGIILAATGKSAQFSLHPWLPAAMEGPTPVSALLHRSTMVVAGVFLLFRCRPLLLGNSWALKFVAVLGAVTALFAARAALVQFDIKKIVAYSTTRQLGLMVVAIGLKIPEMALFHICTHAFFKALLFLCSGRVIHKLKKEQDLRKMSKVAKILPFTIRSIVIGRLALCGLPFLAGYYSKDVILEAGQVRIAKRMRIIVSMVATLMTALYSLRLIFFLIIPFTNTGTINPISEENIRLKKPIIRLTAGVFISGWVIYLCLIKEEPLIVPFAKKITPIIMLAVATIVILNKMVTKSSQKITIFLRKKWFYTKVIHKKTLKITKSSRVSGVLRSLDQGWTSLIGARGLSLGIINLTTKMLKAHRSSIIRYLKYLVVVFLITLFIYYR